MFKKGQRVKFWNGLRGEIIRKEAQNHPSFIGCYKVCLIDDNGHELELSVPEEDMSIDVIEEVKRVVK